MKKLTLVLLPLALTLFNKSYSQAWTPLGPVGATTDTVTTPKMAVDKNGIPYVCYIDAAAGGKVTVQKFVGTSWANVGTPGISPTRTWCNSLAIDTAGTPYVAFLDGTTIAGGITVKKYSGGSWTVVGIPNFASGAIKMAITIDKTTNTPYVAFCDGPHYQSITVMKYSGGSWTTVGTPGFSYEEADYIGICVSKTSVPYVIFRDYGAAYKTIIVMKFDGSNWNALGGGVGGAGISWNSGGPCSLALDTNDVPYASFLDGTSAKVAVMKFDGTAWSYVGSPTFAADNSMNGRLAVDGNNIPYLTYMDWDLKANVMRYVGGSWSNVGLPAFSASYAAFPDIAVRGGKVYVGYADGSVQEKLTVMKYIFPSAVANVDKDADINVYPIPATQSITVQHAKENLAQINIVDISGRVLSSTKCTSNKCVLDVSNLTAGMYILQVNGNYTRPFTKQ